MIEPSWWNQAACAGQPIEIFFPETGNPRGKIRKAKSFCRVCPVSQECLNSALKAEADPTTPRYGIFGGLAPKERNLLFGGLSEVSSSALRTYSC